ncbi:MAG: pilin [Patescibacteria group bacterium]|nr:pilin [Patescibacteria group bacterium]MCL5262185.1 pilin [Patescibacteria group bacterium]
MMLIPRVFAQSAEETVEAAHRLIPSCPETGCGWNEFVILLNNAVDLLLKIVPFIALYWIIYGGFQIMTAGDRKDVYVAGRRKITSAIIGLALVYSSYLIYNLIRGVFSRP